MNGNEIKPTFISYFWHNTKAFWLFVLLVSIVTTCGCVFNSNFYFKEVAPFFCILGAIALTLYIGLKRKFKYLTNQFNDD